MVKKTVEKVRSESPSKTITLDFSEAGAPTVTYKGQEWSGKDVHLALMLVQRGYRNWRYNLAHEKGGVK